MANVLGKDVVFSIGDGAGEEAFDEVDNCLVVGPPNRTWSFEDATYHGQDDLAMRNLPTLFDEGEIVIEMMFDGANTEHTTLFNRMFGSSNSKNNYRVTFGAFKHATFAAWIASPSWTIEKGNHVKLTASFKIDGSVAYTAVS